VDRGYKTVELSASVMGRFVCHLAHATQVVNPLEFNLRKRTLRKCHRLFGKVMSSDVIKELSQDGSLDK